MLTFEGFTQCMNSAFFREHRGLVRGAAAVLVLLISFVVYLNTRTFDRYPRSLPFIVNPQINRTLHSYIVTKPLRDVLYVTGPAKSGKSATISHFLSFVESKSRLVLEIDFSDAKSKADMIGFARLDLMRSFSKLELPENVTKLRSIMETAGMLQNLNEKTLNGEILVSRLQGALIDKLEASFDNSTGFIEFVDTLEQVRDVFRPIMVIYSLEKAQMYVPVFYKAILSKAMTKDQYEDFIPIIIESSDSSLRLNTAISGLRFITIDEIHNSASKLVEEMHAFSPQEYRAITTTLGKTGGVIQTAFESLRWGNTLQDTIEVIQNRISAEVSKHALTKRTLLNRACRAGTKPVYGTAAEINEEIGLFQSGLLYLAEDLSVKLSSPAVCKSTN